MKRITTLLITILIFIFAIPSFAFGVNFYCKNTNHDNCYPYSQKSIGGIYCQMRTNGSEWLKTTPVTSGSWGDETTRASARNGTYTITSTGALCFGHATSSSGDRLARVKAVIDTSATKGTKKEHMLAYWVWKSTRDNEKESGDDGKSRIRKWIHQYYDGIIQQDDTNAVRDYDTTAARNYAEAATNHKFSTTSTATGNQKIEKIGDYTYIGPYNLNFSGGKITSCELKTREGEKVTITHYSDDKGTPKKLKDLTSYNKSKFYLAYKGDIESVEKITLKKEIEVINSRTVLTQPRDRGGQNIAIYYGEKVPSEVELILPEVSYSSLTIKKVDAVTGEKLADIGFIVKHGDKYVKSGSPVTYVSKSNAEVFYTKSNGEIKIENLTKAGNYTVYEVDNPYYKYKKVSPENPEEVGTKNITLGGDFTHEVSNPWIIANLNIIKTDKDTGKKLSNIGFVVHLEGKGYVKKGAKVEDFATYVTDIKDATKFYSNSNGIAEVKNLPEKGNYTVYEVENPYYQYDEVSLEKPLKLGTKKVDDFKQFEMNATNKEIPLIELTIEKIDKDSGKPMEGVGFVVYCKERGGYLVDGLPATYTTDIKKAKVYKTGKDGTVTAKNIRYAGDYYIYEVSNDNFGYEVVSLENPKLMTEQPLKLKREETGNKYTVKLDNKRLYIKISGYVWEDIAIDKTSKPDYLYKENEKDQRLGNVKVTLKKANGEVIDTRITSVKEGAEKGTYIFGDYMPGGKYDANVTKIKIEDLEGAYIEFEYNGMCYKSVPVKSDTPNGSKASDEKEKGASDRSRDEFDAEFATVTKGNAQSGNHSLTYQFADHKATLKYGGTYKYGYDGQKYPISGIDAKYLMTADTYTASPNKLLGQNITIDNIYKQGLTEIPDVNLGVIEREMPDISVVQDVQKAEVSVNGYHHTYNYADRFSALTEQETAFKKQYAQTGGIFDVGVNFAQKYNPGSYTRAIYSADIVYNENETETDKKLKVYITYRVKLTNEAGSVNTRVNEIYNYCDKDYIVHELKELDKDGKFIRDLGKGNRSTYNGQYDKIVIIPERGIELPYNDCKYIEITYEFNNSAIVKLLNEDKTLDSITEVASYSSFEGDFKNQYAGIDRDSEPNNSTIGDKNTYDDDIDQAPSMILKANPGRTIKGTVWEEDAIEELLQKEGLQKQRIGDGQYSKEVEKVIKNVQVDLLKVKDDGSFENAMLYQSQDGLSKTPVNATYVTNNKGEYIFDGVIPDKYVIRFTYKNSSIICNVDGSEIGSIEALEEGVHNYKSTLYRTIRKPNGDLDTSAYNKLAGSNGRWYIDETNSAKRLSDAKDNDEIINKRITVQNLIKNSNANNTEGITEIPAYTSQLEITLEWEEGDLDNISKGTAEFKYEVNNVDFGIIRRPKQDLRIDKQIAYIEVILANGQTLIKGDPSTGTLQHVKYMPDGNVHVELDSEIIQGATLKVKYKIVVNNKNCEIDYNYDKYYINGQIPSDTSLAKVATIVDLFDYPKGLDVNLEENADWQYVENLDSLVTDGRLTSEVREGLRKYNYVLKTNAFESMAPNSEKVVELKLKKLLATTDSDLAFDNDIEVNTYKFAKIDDTTPGNYNPVNGAPNEADDDHVTFVITGPTGEDRQYIPYIIIGITSCMLLAVGIVIVKRKVIK